MDIQSRNSNCNFGKAIYKDSAQKLIAAKLKNKPHAYQKKCEFYISCTKAFDDVSIIVDKKPNKNKLFATMNNKKFTEMNIFRGLKTFLEKVAYKNLENTKQF